MTTTKLHKTTKKALNCNGYFSSSCYSVIDFYAAASSNKRSIESAIKTRLVDNGLIGCKVINCNKIIYLLEV